MSAHLARVATAAVVALIAFVVATPATMPAAPVPNPVPADEGERLLARGKKFAERGQIDLFVACTAAWKLKADDPAMWEPATDLGRWLFEKAEMKGHRKPKNNPSSYKNFATYVDWYKPQFKRMDEAYFRPDPTKAIPRVTAYYEAIQAPGVIDPTNGISNSIVLSQDTVQTAFGISHSVVFANGDVATQTLLQEVIIVSDGDVTVTDGNISIALIVARGNISAKYATCSTLVAGGKVGPEIVKKVPKIADFANVLKENEPKPLGYITFFELAQVGLEVKAADKTVTVTTVTAKSAGEKAGVKVGDVVLEANGKKSADAESLRRLLRDALAVGDATVKLKRGNDTITVKVALPD